QCNRLVFKRGNDTLAVGVGKNVGALDGAAGHTSVRRLGLAARDIWLGALEDGLAQRLATDILHLLEISGGEIPRGQRPEGIGHTSDGRGAVILIDTRLRMLDHCFRVGLLSFFEPLRIRDMRLLPLGRIEYDSLEAFRSHYSSQATTSGDARRTVVLIQVLDA